MASWIWKAAGTAAAAVVAGAAIVTAEKLLKKQQDAIDQKIQADLAAQPEPAEAPAPQEDEPEAPAAPDQPKQAPVQPEPQPEVVYPVSAPDGGPNANPVMAGPAETPRTADGKIDVSKLCDPSDFQDWDMLGCQS